jgi:hypothetical protein
MIDIHEPRGPHCIGQVQRHSEILEAFHALEHSCAPLSKAMFCHIISISAGLFRDANSIPSVNVPLYD